MGQSSLDSYALIQPKNLQSATSLGRSTCSPTKSPNMLALPKVERTAMASSMVRRTGGHGLVFKDKGISGIEVNGAEHQTHHKGKPVGGADGVFVDAPKDQIRYRKDDTCQNCYLQIHQVFSHNKHDYRREIIVDEV